VEKYFVIEVQLQVFAVGTLIDKLS